MHVVIADVVNFLTLLTRISLDCVICMQELPVLLRHVDFSSYARIRLRFLHVPALHAAKIRDRITSWLSLEHDTHCDIACSSMSVS